MKKTYVVNKAIYEARTISGENLIDAIERNFHDIAAFSGAGNAAGAQYESAWLECKTEPHADKAEATLHIISCGSDCLINYDPIEDKPKETVVYIRDISPDEVPNGHYDFTFNEGSENTPSRNPYNDDDNICAAYADYEAFVDEIARSHCNIKDPTLISGYQTKFSGVRRNDPKMYIMRLYKTLMQRKPKSDNKTKQMLDRVDKLSDRLMECPDNELKEAANDYRFLLYSAQAKAYLYNESKITALAYYRKKAGLTGKELAERVGISDRQLRKYENAFNSALGDAKYSVVEIIANELGVKASNLVKNHRTVRVSPDGEEDEEI